MNDVMRLCDCGAPLRCLRACHCDVCEQPLPRSSRSAYLHDACAAMLEASNADARAALERVREGVNAPGGVA